MSIKINRTQPVFITDCEPGKLKIGSEFVYLSIREKNRYPRLFVLPSSFDFNQFTGMKSFHN